QIYIDCRSRRFVSTVFAGVTYDSHNRQQAQIAIHVSKFNGVSKRVLVWPTVVRERLADHSHLRGVGAVTLVEHSSAKQWNSQRLEVSVRRDTKIRVADTFLLLDEDLEPIYRVRNFILRHQQEHS